MILVNHFLDTNLSGILIPNRNASNVTNSAASIMAQANLCSGLYQRTPNFILVTTLPFLRIPSTEWMPVFTRVTNLIISSTG